MRSSLKLALSSLAVLIGLGLLEKVNFEEPLKGFIDSILHHLTIASQGLVVGGFLLLIFEESIAAELGPIVKEGFRAIAESLAGKMVGQGSISEELSRSLREFANQFSPAIGELVKEGRIQEAVAKIDTATATDGSKREEEIAVLLHSHDRQDWERVLLIADEYHLSTRYFLTVAYRLWTSGSVARAILVP